MRMQSAAVLPTALRFGAAHIADEKKKKKSVSLLADLSSKEQCFTVQVYTAWDVITGVLCDISPSREVALAQELAKQNSAMYELAVIYM